MLGGVAHGLGGGGVGQRHRARLTRQQGGSSPLHTSALGHLLGQGAQLCFVRQIEAAGVGASQAGHGGVQIPRQRDGGMGQAQRALRDGHLLHADHRVFHQGFQRDVGVGNPVHEGGVGAVLQQAAHQIGQQGFVGAHRGVDAARAAQATGAGRAHHLFVQRLTHAVQALEFVLARCVLRGASDLVNGRQRVGVVGGELGVHGVGRGQQAAGAGDVGQVGIGLAGVDRVAVHTVQLGAFDLAVPVGTLHQPHHQAVAAAPSQVHDEVDDCGAALLVSLHHKTNALPAGQRGLETQALQQVER